MAFISHSRLPRLIYGPLLLIKSEKGKIYWLNKGDSPINEVKYYIARENLFPATKILQIRFYVTELDLIHQKLQSYVRTNTFQGRYMIFGMLLGNKGALFSKVIKLGTIASFSARNLEQCIGSDQTYSRKHGNI